MAKPFALAAVIAALTLAPPASAATPLSLLVQNACPAPVVVPAATFGSVTFDRWSDASGLRAATVRVEHARPSTVYLVELHEHPLLSTACYTGYGHTMTTDMMGNGTARLSLPFSDGPGTTAWVTAIPAKLPSVAPVELRQPALATPPIAEP